MVDVHCHLNFKAFENDYDEVIKRAVEAGVDTIINVGTKLDTSQRAVEMASQYDNLYAIVGVHPHHADKVTLEKSHPEQSEGSLDDWMKQLKQIAKSSTKVVAIGEIGMDNYRYQSNGITDPKAQRELFERQIELAYKLKLPLQIHNRHAGKEILEVLNAHKNLLMNIPGMFHCFSGNLAFLKRVLDLGFYVGFDGNITYKGLAPGEDTSLPDLVKATPIDKIVIETDSPYLTPEPHRGSRNEPSYAIIISRVIAQIKGIPFEEVVSQTNKNTHTIFRLNS
ncbi:MAG: TatD family hydrolase [Candidatus Levybacteria bacterium]|nr:TatD family hydrolase [Candidatus Levybacteria bacterium]